MYIMSQVKQTFFLTGTEPGLNQTTLTRLHTTSRSEEKPHFPLVSENDKQLCTQVKILKTETQNLGYFQKRAQHYRIPCWKQM
jgi:hypothetical protein